MASFDFARQTSLRSGRTGMGTLWPKNTTVRLESIAAENITVRPERSEVCRAKSKDAILLPTYYSLLPLLLPDDAVDAGDVGERHDDGVVAVGDADEHQVAVLLLDPA